MAKRKGEEVPGFGDVLREWEKKIEERAKNDRVPKKAQTSSDWTTKLGAYPIDKDVVKDDEDSMSRSRGRRHWEGLPIERSLDLHGKFRAEAEDLVTRFLSDAAREGAVKVLIITGKGKHTSGDAVLGKAVREILEKNRYVGPFGHPSEKTGGRGAYWVILKKRGV